MDGVVTQTPLRLLGNSDAHPTDSTGGFHKVIRFIRYLVCIFSHSIHEPFPDSAT